MCNGASNDFSVFFFHLLFNPLFLTFHSASDNRTSDHVSISAIPENQLPPPVFFLFFCRPYTTMPS